MHSRTSIKGIQLQQYIDMSVQIQRIERRERRIKNKELMKEKKTNTW